MKKDFFAVLALLATVFLWSCGNDDEEGSNRPERPKIAVPRELRAIHYNRMTNDIFGFNVYKLQPESGSSSQKAYEVRKYTASLEGNPSWDLDFLADNELEYNIEEGNYYQSEFYQRLGKDYNVSKYTNSMPKARYNSKGLVECIGEFAKNTPNSREVNFTYNRDGKLTEAVSHCNLYLASAYIIEVNICSSFKWENGNLVAIDRVTRNGNDDTILSQTNYRFYYTEYPKIQPSLLCLIFNDMFDEPLVNIVDYDDFFADRYGLMTDDLMTGMDVREYIRCYPDVNDMKKYEWVVDDENSSSYAFIPAFDGQGLHVHYDVSKRQGTADDWIRLYAYDIKY